MAYQIETDSKDLKTIRKEFQKNGVFYTSSKLAKHLKSYLPADAKEVYDPTCGGGALLAVFGDDVKKYGQELDPQQAQYCRDTLINCEIATGNTLTEPAFLDKKFKAIIANPPYSIKWEPKQDERFEACPVLAPKSKADYAFIMHCLHYLVDDGKAVILLPHGVLFRQSAEGELRKWLVDNNYIERLVSFDKGYFEDTNIPTLAMVLSKKKDNTDVIIEDTRINLGRLVSYEEIQKNDYNLNIPRYVFEEIKPVEYDYEAECKAYFDSVKESLKVSLDILRTISNDLQEPLIDYKECLKELKGIIDDAS